MKAPHVCAWGDCDKLARWRVGWRAWALGKAKGSHGPMEAFLLQCVVCDEHRASINVKDLLLPEGRARINSAMLAMGRALPDLDNAELAFQDVLADPPPPNALKN